MVSQTVEMMTDAALIRKLREVERESMLLMIGPAPTADGALMGYEAEISALDFECDELLEEVDRRGFDREAALFSGVIKRVRAETRTS